MESRDVLDEKRHRERRRRRHVARTLREEDRGEQKQDREAVELALRPWCRRLRSGTATGWNAWPSADVEADAAQAVALADQDAAPSSRFVAVASSQAVTDQDPVLLFLLSSRLPYTRWFQYDPGLQSSPRIQQEMIEELTRSQSRTAVVWRAEAWMLELPGRPLPPTPFDEAFDRLYPVVVARVGLYEVRRRVESGPPAGAAPR